MSNSFDANSPSPTSAGSDLPHFSSKNILLIAILVISVVLILLIFIFGLRLNPFQSLTQPKSGNTTNTVSGTLEMKKFNSEQEFKDYLQQSQQSGSVGIFNFGTGRAVTDLAIPQQGFAQPFSAKEEAPAADRFSQTNVQVKGIDEPDIVKTDGKISSIQQISNSLPF